MFYAQLYRLMIVVASNSIVGLLWKGEQSNARIEIGGTKRALDKAEAWRGFVWIRGQGGEREGSTWHETCYLLNADVCT